MSNRISWEDVIEGIRKAKAWMEDNKDETAKVLRTLAVIFNKIADWLDPVA